LSRSEVGHDILSVVSVRRSIQIPRRLAIPRRSSIGRSLFGTKDQLMSAFLRPLAFRAFFGSSPRARPTELANQSMGNPQRHKRTGAVPRTVSARKAFESIEKQRNSWNGV